MPTVADALRQHADSYLKQYGERMPSEHRRVLAAITRCRTGALGHPPEQQATQGESTILSRLSPNAVTGRDWAELAQSTSDRARHARGVNVDPAMLVLDALLKLQSVRATA